MLALQDGINGIMGSPFARAQDKIEFIQVRHEEMAAFASAMLSAWLQAINA